MKSAEKMAEEISKAELKIVKAINKQLTKLEKKGHDVESVEVSFLNIRTIYCDDVGILTADKNI